MNKNEEDILIESLQNPSTRHQAFEIIVNKYKRQLYGQIRRMVYMHEDTDDILQNVFLKAWTNIDSFRGDSKISTWLYRIAVNETLNFLQKQKEISSIDLSDENICNILKSDDYFDGDETELQLQQAISQLPEKQRAVFNMKYFEEMKYEEMSQIMNTSIGALKASYHHAVKKISDFFKMND